MITLSTGSLYLYGLSRVFALAAEAGYDGIEVLVDHRWDSRHPSYLRRLSEEHGLPIAALHSPFVGYVPGWPRDQLGRLERTVALARELGVQVVVTHLPIRLYRMSWRWQAPRRRGLTAPIPWLWRDAYHDFLSGPGLAEMEAETGITVAVENMPASRFLGLRLNRYWFNTPERWARFPHVTLDTTHLGTWGLNPLAVYERVKERVAHVHLSNYDGAEHRAPPDGHLPLAELLRRLARDGYRGAVSVESDPFPLQAEDARICLANLRRSLAFCREHFRQVALSD